MNSIGSFTPGQTLYGTSLLPSPVAPATFVASTTTNKAPQVSLSANHGSLKVPGSAAHKAVISKLEKIANNPSLTDKQKRAAMNDLRKQLGLSKGDMKKYFTRHLANLYKQAIARLKASGPLSLEQQNLLEKLQEKQKLYASMYKAGGCIKKVFKGIGNTFKGIGKTLLGTAIGILNPKNWIKPSFWRDFVAPLALNFIPGIGPIAATAYRYAMVAYNGVKAVTSMAKGRFVDGLAYASQTVADLGVKVQTKVANWVQKGTDMVQKGLQWYQDIKNFPQTVVNTAIDRSLGDSN